MPQWLLHCMFCVNRYTIKAKISSEYPHDINLSFSGTVKNGRYPSLSSCWETDTENLFYIGKAMAAIDRQSAFGFIHGFRYNIRTLHNILENRSFSAPLPQTTIPDRKLQQIAEKLLVSLIILRLMSHFTSGMIQTSMQHIHFSF